jgi:hypothetical protein
MWGKVDNLRRTNQDIGWMISVEKIDSTVVSENSIL